MSASVRYLSLLLAATAISPITLRGQDVPVLGGQDVPGRTAAEAAIRKVGTEYVDAFNKADAARLAGYWSPESVYVNRISGEQVVGRDAIAAQFKALFAAAPDLKLAVDRETQRTAWTVGAEDWPVMETGISNLTEDQTPALIHFENGQTQKWLLVRLEDPNEATQQ